MSNTANNYQPPAPANTNGSFWNSSTVNLTVLMGAYIGGQVVFNMYKMTQDHKKMSQKKQYIKSEKDKMAKNEREQYEKKIQELTIERDEYKNKYFELLARPDIVKQENGQNKEELNAMTGIDQKIDKLTTQLSILAKESFQKQIEEALKYVQTKDQKGKETEVVNTRMRSNSKEEEKIDPNILIQRSIKQDLTMIKNSDNLHKICITGGPCAGKTTALAMLQSDLQQLGFLVLTIPEAATLLMKGGAMIVSSQFTKYQGLKFQKALLRLQIALEQSFTDLGLMISQVQETVILIDRGLMDGSAYVEKSQWKGLMDELGVTQVQLRDQRYDAVLHLVTAADGAEKFYDSATNEARYETIQEAREKDVRLREAYMTHPKWYLIDNQVDTFENKMIMAKAAVHHALQRPIGDWFEGKYLIKHEMRDSFPLDLSKFPPHEKLNKYMDFIIKKNSDGSVVESSIEKRGNDESGYCYIQNIKNRKIIDGKEYIIEKKKNIMPSDYFKLLDLKDPAKRTLRVNRVVMIDFNFYYTIDYYPDIKGQPMILIVKKGLPQNVQKIKYNPIDKIVPIFREISNETGYQVENMASIDFEMPQKDAIGTQLLPKNNFQSSGPKKTKQDVLDMIDKVLEEFKETNPKVAEKLKHQEKIQTPPKVSPAKQEDNKEESKVAQSIVIEGISPERKPVSQSLVVLDEEPLTTRSSINSEITIANDDTKKSPQKINNNQSEHQLE